jgi:hypothetical protein
VPYLFASHWITTDLFHIYRPTYVAGNDIYNSFHEKVSQHLHANRHFVIDFKMSKKVQKNSDSQGHKIITGTIIV